MPRRFVRLALITTLCPAIAHAACGTLTAPGLSGTFTPTANLPFSVTIDPKASPTPGTSGVWSLERSQDGVNFSPVAPPPGVAQLGPVTFSSPITFDVLETRAGTTYALLLVRINSGSIACRFDQ